MFVSGVIEGFYGPPWSSSERLAAFALMASSGLNTYLYCPKDDLHHRAMWRQPYDPAAASALAAVITNCQASGLRFLYGIGPGLDVQYSSAADRDLLRDRCAQMLGLGVDGIALLFDDIPDRLDERDLERWGSLAAAQASLVNETAAAIRQRDSTAAVAFCPTPYCGRMAAAQHGGAGYLETVGVELHPEVAVFWTGPDIVSAEITVDHVRDVARRLRRQPLIWDNLHANDYDGRRMLLGPYSGRPLALRAEVAGILTNPNTEFPLNHMAVRTLGAFLAADGDWQPRQAYLAALEEWQVSFATVGGAVSLDDLVLLADCYYLPHQEGPAAEALIDGARLALTDRSDNWRLHAEAFREVGGRLRELCGRLATLYDRSLFHAMHRRLWDLREELDLLVKGAEARLRGGDPDEPFRSDFHLPGLYRGGTVARLQALLSAHADGTFTPSRHDGTS